MVRHGESTWNRERRLQGQAMEPALTDVGLAQAREAAATVCRLVEHSSSVRLISSDQTRAWQTAAALAVGLGVPVEAEVRLREQGLGEMEGASFDDLVALPVPEGQHISEIAWAPGGETIQQVHERLTELVAELRRDPRADTLVLVSHGDTIRVLLAVLDGVGHRDVDWVPIANGEVLERQLTR